MFETKIKFQGKERKVKFGAWVTGNIEKLVNKGDFGNIEVLASLIFYALIMGEKLRPNFTAKEELPFDIFDCYDWIDEQGGITSDITIRVVSKFTKKGTTSIVEDIAMEVDNRIRGTIKKRDENVIGIGRVRLSVNRLLVENSDTHTAYSKVLIYQNDLYLTNN